MCSQESGEAAWYYSYSFLEGDTFEQQQMVSESDFLRQRHGIGT